MYTVSAFLVYYVYYIRGYENENFVTTSLMRTSLTWVNIVESHCARLSSWPGVISRFAIASEMFSGSRVGMSLVTNYRGIQMLSASAVFIDRMIGHRLLR